MLQTFGCLLKTFEIHLRSAGANIFAMQGRSNHFSFAYTWRIFFMICLKYSSLINDCRLKMQNLSS